MLTKFIFSWFLTLSPLIISGGLILILVINSLWPDRSFFKKITTKKLIYILLSLTIFFNLLLSGLQYFTWHASPLSHFFLPPFTPITYFLGYIFYHFWLSSLVVLICALALYFIFKLIKKYRAEIISQEELLLIFLSCLLVGWPNLAIFVPMFFLLTLIFILVNLVVFKKSKNALTWPLLLSLIITFFFGYYLINLLSLSVLNI